MEYHALADVFPVLSQNEIESLAADIKANGLRHAITLYQGKILDGRNRFVACELAGVAPRFDEYTGDDPTAFVISENIARRHLDESQRAMCAARLATMGKGQPSKSNASIEALSQPEAAALLNVSRPSVQRAAQVIANGAPELIQAVDNGEIAVSRAATIAREPVEVQREIVKQAPHVSHNSGNNEWYTPPEFIEAARQVLGGIDLDPASSSIANQVVKAKKFYSVDDDGLAHKWRGRLWMNPPYASDLIGKFTGKFAAHVEAGDITAGIVLVNNATETAWFQALSDCCAAVCFPRSRISYISPDGESKSPLQGQAFLYFGPDVEKFNAEFERIGNVFYARC